MLEQSEGRPAPEVTDAFCGAWRHTLVATDFTVGCSLLAVTVSASPGDLRDRAGSLFGDWRTLLARLLTAWGVYPNRTQPH